MRMECSAIVVNDSILYRDGKLKPRVLILKVVSPFEMSDGRQERISQIALISSEEYKQRNLIKGTVIHVGKKS